jgi:hypothetical protein
MNVLLDFLNHTDLFYGLYRLLEERLGYTVYVPEGKEWVDRGFVTMPGAFTTYEPDGIERVESANGITLCHRKMQPSASRYLVRGVRFEKFLTMDFELVVTGVYAHEQPFYGLVRQHKPTAKLIRQIANIHEKPLGFCKNILLAAAYHPLDFGGEGDPRGAFAKRGERVFVYYPEHHDGYSYTPPTNSKHVICLSRHIAPDDMRLWNQYRHELEPLGFTFKMYGLQYQPYPLDPVYGESIPHLLLSEGIGKAGFVWYTKPNGGGGFTARQALSVGRPLILRKRYSSAHTRVECELYRHGVNCIDLDFAVGTELIREWGAPAMHSVVCRRVADLFQHDTQYAKTAAEIGGWIESLPRGVT